MSIDLNRNNLDPRLQQIVDILDKRDRHWFNKFMDVVNKLKAELDPEQYDHALQDIEFTLERRMVKRKKGEGSNELSA